MTILLCGMGNIERGDDGFGPYVVDHLGSTDHIKILDCGMYIENYLNKIVDINADLIILLDTIDYDSKDIILIRNEEIIKDQSLSITTHNLPFNTIYDYLRTQCRAEIWLLGVKPISYDSFTERTKTCADRIIQIMEFLDSRSKINIMNVYETLSSTLR
jgi:hydrogenase maturation protease